MTSKFRGILDQAKQRDPEPEAEAPPVAPTAPPAEPPPSPASKRRGRPNGKRSDPQFVQVTAYIPEATHRAVKIALLQEGKGQEFSELVEALLARWLKSRT